MPSPSYPPPFLLSLLPTVPLFPLTAAASAKLGGGITAECIQRGFEETEGQFASLVRQAFDQSPHVAMVGACSASVFITPSALWAANVGDCRAVLGQVSRVGW